MSDSITLEDFYKLFQRSQEETERRAAEFDRQLAESSARFDRELAESSARFDRELAESRAEFDRRVAEADRQLAESKAEAAKAKAQADRSMEELRKVVANTSREVANLTTRWGQFVENLVEPGVIRLFQARGIAVKETHPRIKAKRDTVAMEIDILAVDDDVAVAVEVKSRLSKGDVDEFLEKLALFKQAFPRYADVKLNGAVAGIEVDEGVDRYAYRQGLFVIKQSGETVEIVNDETFRPKIW